MATGHDHGNRSNPQPIPQPTHRGAPAPNIGGSAVSPPSRRELASWWKKFSRKTEKEEQEKVVQPPGIFGIPLSESIRYANVAISLTNEQGESFIYGYVPIVVAKCGVFLKEKATDVEGIFRLSGSAKRIKDLQNVFNSPERYGKGLDWTGYTVHDAANILRRYLNQLPEPIVPLNQYERFRDPLRAYQQRLENHPEGQAPPEITATEHANAVLAYQRLIKQLPALNRQLLLYILDLLAVFSSKSDLNRMTAANLAAIFQPGIISHPVHDMAPQEYRLSQDVLIFLIENQDNFLIGMSGTGLDEKTQKDVESGAPSAKSPKSNIGRSASNASAGADSLRKYGIRRNVSVSSHASRERTSPNVSNPGTPVSPSYTPSSTGIGVARSNTVPSKRSPAVGQHRFQRVADSSTPGSPTTSSIPTETGSGTTKAEKRISAVDEQLQTSTANDTNQPTLQRGSEVATVPFPEVPLANQPVESQQTAATAQPALQVPKNQTSSVAQTRERKISNLFSKSPIFAPSDIQQNPSSRQPRKLQKRQKLPGTMMESAQSSAASLQGDDPFHTPLVSPEALHGQTDPPAAATPATGNSAAVHNPDLQNELTPPRAQDIQGRGVGPPKSPATSLRSGTSMTDPSDFDALDDPVSKAEKKRTRWRFSSSAARKTDDGPLAPPPPIGQMVGARTSNSSIGSSSRPRQSFTTESHFAQMPVDTPSASKASVIPHPNQEYYEQTRDVVTEPERKGFIGKLKAKMAQSKEERREREAERERAKSPQRMTGDNVSSRQSLSAFAHDHFSPRGRSFDKSREDVMSASGEQQKPEAKRGSVSSNTAAILPSAPIAAPAQMPPSVQASTPAPVPMSVPAQAVAPQTASITTPAAAPGPALDPAPGVVATTDPPPAAIGVAISGDPGPAVVSHPMPVVEEEPRLEIDTQVSETSAPDSVQHTPTEIKNPPLDKSPHL